MASIRYEVGGSNTGDLVVLFVHSCLTAEAT